MGESSIERTEISEPRLVRYAATNSGKPVLVVVMGDFSDIATQRSWTGLEPVFNPGSMFREVHVLALGDVYTYRQFRFGTVTVHPVVVSSTRRRLLKRVDDFLLLLAGIARLRQIVLEHDVDLLVQTWSTPVKFGLPAVIVGQLTGRPSVITLCSDYRMADRVNYSWWMRWLTRPIWKYLFRNCTCVRSKSQYIAGFAYEHGVPAEKVWVVPNKEALDTFCERPSEDSLSRMASDLGLERARGSGRVILTCARLIVAKNLSRMLKAISVAGRDVPGLAYLIAGTGPLLERLQAEARELQLDGQVRFLGNVPHSELRLVYHLADILLFPTLYEGQPRAVIQALLAKLPIICSNYGSVCELVRPDIDGIYVDPLDVEEIARAIVRLARNESLRQRLARHEGFDSEKFSLERVGMQEVQLYQSALSARSRVGC